MRTDTVMDLLARCRREDERNFENNFKQKCLGITVLTNYNNKTYRIDDVDFAITPASTFTKKGEEITIQQYYKDVRGLISDRRSKISRPNFFSFLKYVSFDRDTSWKYGTQLNRY